MIKNKPARGSTNYPDHIMISINGDPKTSMAITWRTDISVTNGYVEYRDETGEAVRRTAAITEAFESDIDSSNMHWARLTGLEPGTKYYYTCGDENNRSDEYYFTTQKKDLTAFKFICVSDQQKGEPFETPDYSHFNQLLKRYLAENPDTAFILTAGDNTDCGQHEQQWNGAMLGFKGVAEYYPL